MVRGVGLIVCVALIGAAGGVTLTSAATGKGATVRPVSMVPLKVRGQAFKSREVVRVWVTSGKQTVFRRVVATGTGTFTVTFSDVTYGDPCSSDLAILGRGARGSVASYKLPMRQCPPSLGSPRP